MSAVKILCKKLLGFFLSILGLFKRLICRIRGRRKNSGNLLPVTNHFPVTNNIPQSVPSNEVELQSWDNWGMEDSPASVSVDTNHHDNHGLHGRQYPNKQNVEPELEPEIDYFSDMVPAIKKPKKILIKKKEDAHYSGGFSSRLAMTSEVPIADGELGTWEEVDNGWDEGVNEDLSWEAEAAIKERRRLEREHRQMEQLRKKQEREAGRTNRKDSGSLAAVKLS